MEHFEEKIRPERKEIMRAFGPDYQQKLAQIQRDIKWCRTRQREYGVKERFLQEEVKQWELLTALILEHSTILKQEFEEVERRIADSSLAAEITKMMDSPEEGEHS